MFVRGDKGGRPYAREVYTGIDGARVGRILGALQVGSLVCFVFAGLVTLAEVGEWSTVSSWVVLTYSVVTISVAVLWGLRARMGSSRSRAVIAVLVAVVTPLVNVIGSIGFTTPVLLLAIAFLVMDISPAAGLAGAVWMGAVGFTIHTVFGNGFAVAVVNTIPVVALMGVGVFLGATLRAHDAAHRRDERVIAERDAAVERLESAMDRLRRTAEVEKELVLADERARSARDLHDGLGHRLTLISMSLEFAQRMRDRDPHAAWNEVATADETSREALSQMRTWVRALSPVRDADATGMAAFEAIAESFRGTGLDVIVDKEGDDVELTENASLLLYRTVQEGLTNALRHGRADRVDITQRTDREHVGLWISNDLDETARGELAHGSVSRGFGLRGLADRAASLGGNMTAGREGDRFVLVVRLPRNSTVVSDAPVTDQANSEVRE